MRSWNLKQNIGQPGYRKGSTRKLDQTVLWCSCGLRRLMVRVFFGRIGQELLILGFCFEIVLDYRLSEILFHFR